MSMRSSIVYGSTKPLGEKGGSSWHGWDQIDEVDAFYLDVAGPNGQYGVGDDYGDMKDTSGFTVRMPMSVFKAIVREYNESEAESAALTKRLRDEDAAFESNTGKCASCCKYGEYGEAQFKPRCQKCGGTGKSHATIAKESK